MFFFLSIFSIQAREKLIADASRDLEENKISPRQFILRVAYRSKAFVMTDMESVNENKDELLFDLLKASEDAADVATNAPIQQPQISLCIICRTSPDLQVIFTLCKHLLMCISCFDAYIASKRAEHEDIVEMHLPAAAAPFTIECPSCRAL